MFKAKLCYSHVIILGHQQNNILETITIYLLKKVGYQVYIQKHTNPHKPARVAHVCNASTWEAEAKGERSCLKKRNKNKNQFWKSLLFSLCFKIHLRIYFSSVLLTGSFLAFMPFMASGTVEHLSFMPRPFLAPLLPALPRLSSLSDALHLPVLTSVLVSRAWLHSP